MHEMSLLTAFYIGFCAGAMLITLFFIGALTIASWRERRKNQLTRPNEHIGQTGLANMLEDQAGGLSRTQSFMDIVNEYACALQMLDDYDHQRLAIVGTTVAQGPKITYQEVIEHITLWREQKSLGPLFGNQKDDSFLSSLDSIYATFDHHDLYPSVQEKAANLLYFVVKNHSFTDGNKRIGAAMLVWFLHQNGCLYTGKGQKYLADNALVAVTLLIAQSKPEDKDSVTALVVNLINHRN